MTRSSLLRPTLLPGLRPLWRDPHTVQLGTDPAQAVVLELPHPAAAKLLDLLDGAHTERAILAEMGRIGMSEADVQIVLGALSEAGLVVAAHSLLPSALPAEHRHRVAAEAAALALRIRDRAASPATILRRRYHCRVIIAGSGPFAPLLTSALLAAGIGTVGQVTEPGAAAVPVDPIPLDAALTPPPPTTRHTTAAQSNATGAASEGQGGTAGTARKGARQGGAAGARQAGAGQGGGTAGARQGAAAGAGQGARQARGKAARQARGKAAARQARGKAARRARGKPPWQVQGKAAWRAWRMAARKTRGRVASARSRLRARGRGASADGAGG